jgi:hypothetical protein
MDYEFKILLLEKETAHLREMQALTRAHVDVHDTTLASLEQIALRTERNLEAISAHVEALAAKLEALVAALLREHPNGH